MCLKLTVIIPIYKVEKYIIQCLDSVVNQSFKDMEIILIDDGSPDRCGEICDEYAKLDSRIQVIHKENAGLCAARNDGIRIAKGEWITFVDSDDWCETNYYKELFHRLGDQDVDVFFAGGHFLDSDKQQKIKINFKNPFYFDEKEKMDFLMAKILAPWCCVEENIDASSAGSPWDKLYKRSFLEDNQLLFDESDKACEDLWFNFKVFDCARKVAGCTYIGYHYRMIATSITKSFNPNRLEINYRFISKLYDYMSGREDNSMIQSAIYVRSINMIAQALRTYYFNQMNQDTYLEKARQIKEMKKKPYYSAAIHDHKTPYLTKKQRLLQAVLKGPLIWPLYVLNGVNNKMIQ